MTSENSSRVYFVEGSTVCRLPLDLNWKHVFGAGLLGGIGFTMAIFITNLAFVGNAGIISASKIAILLLFTSGWNNRFSVAQTLRQSYGLGHRYRHDGLPNR